MHETLIDKPKKSIFQQTCLTLINPNPTATIPAARINKAPTLIQNPGSELANPALLSRIVLNPSEEK